MKPTIFLSLLGSAFPALLSAIDVSNITELNTELQANTTEISFTQDIQITSRLFPVNSDGAFDPVSPGTTNIYGNNQTLIGNSDFTGFFIRGANIRISDLTFSGCATRGGNGGDTRRGAANGGGGGGAAGIGGGLFIADGASVVLKNASFINCSAQGGNGGNASTAGDANGGGGGGGGRGNPIGGVGNIGNGGAVVAGSFIPGGGGGGMFFNGSNGAGSPSLGFGGGGGGVGSTGTSNNGGNNFDGVGGGIAMNNPPDATANGAGGARATNAANNNGGNGGYGGGGGASRSNSGANQVGGTGGSFGGGSGGTLPGSTFSSTGGSGGFAGGGGGGSAAAGDATPGNGGTGGFGSGGGGGGSNSFGTAFASGGSGGPFGGNGGPSTTVNPAGGGGGAGLGGAIFLQSGSEITFEESVSFSGSSVAAGSKGLGSDDGFDGEAAGVDIFMMSDSQCTFDLTSNVILQNPIIGDIGASGADPNTKGLTKKGPALLSLAGDNTYSGVTIVEEGELRIISSVITPVIVEEPATLSGSFLLLNNGAITGSGDLMNHGLVSPGVNGIGTIFLDGQFTQTSTGIFQIDITPDGTIHDAIMGATNADLAGKMEVILNAGNYIAGTQYVVIDAPTNGTQFEEVVFIGEFGLLLDFQVDYSSVIITVLNTVLFADQTIDPGPPTDVANAIIQANIVPNSDFAIVVENLGLLNNAEVNRALTSLSGVLLGSFEWVNARNNSLVASILAQHLFEVCCSANRCNCCSCNSNLWASGFGNFMNNKKTLDYLSKYDADASGALAGVDFCACDCVYYGAAVGYTHTALDWSGSRGKADVNSYYGALYGSLNISHYDIDFSLIGGGSDTNYKRKLQFANIDRKAKGDFWGYFVTAHLGFSSQLECSCNTYLKPFLLADYHYYTHRRYLEKGADSINLRVHSKEQHIMRGEAGLAWRFDCAQECSCVSPYLGLSWVGEFPLNTSKQPANFVGQSPRINATSYKSNIQLASPQGGIKWTHTNGFSALVEYKGLFNPSTAINQVEGRLELLF